MKALRHPALDRPRAKQADIGDHVVDGARPQAREQVLLAGGLELEQTDGVRILDHQEREQVVERHLAGVVQVDSLAGGPPDLRDRVRHRRLHPNAEHVELDQPECFHLVLVPQSHRESLVGGGSERQTVAQPGIGDDHPARVLAEVLDQAVEGFGHLPQQLVARTAPRQMSQLRQIAQSTTDAAGA